MLTGFTLGLMLITICELGDKSFFIALLLAMRHSRRLVFIGAILALIAMTLLSVLMGSILTFFPKSYTHYGAIALFCFFGINLLFKSTQMPAHAVETEVIAAKEAIETTGSRLGHRASAFTVVCQSSLLTFLTEWGDRTQIATITLAAAHHPLGVTFGAILGHTLCTLLAVMGGRLIAGRISERTVTMIGGTLFLLFAIMTWWEGI